METVREWPGDAEGDDVEDDLESMLLRSKLFWVLLHNEWLPASCSSLAAAWNASLRGDSARFAAQKQGQTVFGVTP